ncbi:MAG: DUF4129 domain-containing protein [Pirellulaceae bacterium]
MTLFSHLLSCAPRAVFIAFAFLLPLGGEAYCLAADSVDSEEVLAGFPEAKWFDSETDSYRAPKVTPFRDNPIREDGWSSTPREEATWDWEWPDWLTGANANWSSSVLAYILYGMLIVAAIAVICLVVWFLLRDSFPSLAERSRQPAGEIEIDAARIEDLPFETRPNMGDPLAAARELFSRGKLDAALVYLYGYMLLAMDRRQHIYLQKGKTNRMYLREIGMESLRDTVRPVQLAFEDSFFGKHPITAEQFGTHWEAIEQFHLLVAESPVRPTNAAPKIGVTA